MGTLATRRTGHKNEFDVVAKPFAQDQGLRFADVLDAESIERVFPQENALFAQDDLFSTPTVLWAFLAQTLRDGKGAACEVTGSRGGESVAGHAYVELTNYPR
ncbi:MAG: hypothetical protein JXQ73_02135 [Phycisphaerae bacterium]|nr:hypothetical protein [Phycisphaerae bacterium]